jgi:hypothetical protein
MNHYEQVDARAFTVLDGHHVYCKCGRVMELYKDEDYYEYEPCRFCMDMSSYYESYRSPVFVFDNLDNNPDPYFTCRRRDDEDDEDEPKVKYEELYWVYELLAKPIE